MNEAADCIVESIIVKKSRVSFTLNAKTSILLLSNPTAIIIVCDEWQNKKYNFFFEKYQHLTEMQLQEFI